ncbi:type IV pilus modification protein PilV [Candidatus Albibeggiatoa sp. nov. NOAA]|uniref:type IV pilus modification protein PilV n=1 Tax=Candidatus Albibeggiatoa sp. nov. NOAA TaxID=3162724 RepID=UPI0032F19510|nr:type IV pilus modification protein PilV [Thiotrichaceae bacterium]
MQKQLLTQHNAGFSMLEMMIALLILSIGLIGIASLQARGQQFNHSAYVRTQAAFLAYDIMDRMRANKDNLDNNNADNGSYAFKEGACPEANISCDTTACSVTDIVSYDLGSWCQSLESTLPLGKGEISWDTNDSLYTITIYWTEDRDEDAELKKQSWNITL